MSRPDTHPASRIGPDENTDVTGLSSPDSQTPEKQTLVMRSLLSLSTDLGYRGYVEQSSQIEPNRPEPLRSLVVVGPVSEAGVVRLVGVDVVSPVGPVPGLEGGEAERSEEEVGDGLQRWSGSE